MVIKYVLRGYMLYVLRVMSVRAMWVRFTSYAVCDTQYALRAMWVCGYELHITQYVIRGYPYTTPPRSLRLKVCLRFGNGLAFWI